MQQPGEAISQDVQVHGPATAEISVGGDVVETRDLP
jgi:hypothetical protein